MPPEKRKAGSLKVGFGPVEMTLLETLNASLGGSYAEHVRLAVRYYAKHNPQLKAQHVRLYAKGVAKTLDDEARTRFERDLESYLANEVELPRFQGDESAGRFTVSAGQVFDSDSLELDED
jgi:hypothetical protein